jgi:release factor glutamine methyltransferase
MRELDLARGAAVADVFTGSGVLALAAWRAGAHPVSAVDISRRACLNARINAVLNGAPIRVHRGDLFQPLKPSRFDLIVANPPYVPGTHPGAARGAARAWEGGSDGRVLVERLCAEAPARLRPGGSVLLVQSSLTGEEETLQSLAERGLEPQVVARERGRLGPIVAGRAEALEARGVLAPGEREEEILVIRGTARRSTTVPDAMSAASVEGD